MTSELPIYTRPAANGKPLMLRTHMFLFRTSQKEIRPTADDVREAQWVDQDGVAGRLSLEEGKEYFKTIRNEIS